MQTLIFRAALALACSSLLPAQAVELSNDDPVRKSLIEAVHQMPQSGLEKGDRLVVKRAWASADYAFLCAFVGNGKGQLYMTDDYYDVFYFYFKKKNGQWQGTTGSGSLSAPNKAPDCVSDARLPLSDENIRAVLDGKPHPSLQAAQYADAKERQQCAQLAASTHGITNLPPREATTRGEGKILMYSAPGDGCENGKHLVAGDKVQVERDNKGWAMVLYRNPKTGSETRAWVKEQRLLYAF